MVAPYPAEANKIVGGVAAVTSYLSKSLTSDCDIELHGVSFGPRGSSYKYAEKFGYPVHYLPSRRLGPLTLYRGQRASFDALMKRLQPDLIHGQGVDLPGYLAAVSNYPNVVTVHGLVGEDAKFLTGLKTRWRAKLVSRRIERRTIQMATNVISISPFVEQYYGSRLRAATYNIPNPIADHFYRVERRPELGRFLFAGHVNPRKGVSDLIRAFSQVAIQPGVRLILAGSLDVNPGYVERVRRLCRELGIEDQVEFRGLLTTQELLEELSKAHALVLASYQETAPMVIQEAMAAGVAVIASRICGVPYQVGHGETGWLVEPGEIDDLSERMRNLLVDSSLAERMGSAARTKALAYRAESVARQTADVYEKILARANSIRVQ